MISTRSTRYRSLQISLYDDLPERVQEIIDDDLDKYIYIHIHKPISDTNIKLLHAVISPFKNGIGSEVGRCLLREGRKFFVECSWCGEWRSNWNSCKCSKSCSDSFKPTKYVGMKHIKKGKGKYYAIPFSYVCEPALSENHPHFLRLYPSTPYGPDCDGCSADIKNSPYWHCDTCHDIVLGKSTFTFLKRGFDMCIHCYDNPDTWSPNSDIEYHKSSDEPPSECYDTYSESSEGFSSE